MRPAVTCGEQTISRAELLAGAHRPAGRFAELGVAHASVVTLGLPNSIEFIEAMFAA
jgi:bile acid-coenzyme A ligase